MSQPTLKFRGKGDATIIGQSIVDLKFFLGSIQQHRKACYFQKECFCLAGWYYSYLGMLQSTVDQSHHFTRSSLAFVQGNCAQLLLLVYVAARALATYLIPGCVGRGVRLGSESSSGGAGAGGGWKSGDLEI